MSGSVNKVIIVGHLGADPEVRTMANGKAATNLRVATRETWSERSSGDRKERTEWHSVRLFSQASVNYTESYLTKGSKVYIEGRLQTRKWQDQSGRDRYTTEIVVNDIDGKIVGLNSNNATITSTATVSYDIQHNISIGDVPF